MKPNRKTTWKTSSHYHLKKVFDDGELREDSVIRNFRITADDGKTYDTCNPNFKGIEFERFRTEAGSSYNPDFNYGEFAIIKSKAGLNIMRTLLSDNNIKRLK